MPKMKIVLIIVAVFIVWFFSAGFVVADKYEAEVNIKEEVNIMGASLPIQSLDFGNLSKGIKTSRSLILNNDSKNKILIKVLSFGEISDFIKTSKKSFVLGSGEKTEIIFDLDIPFSAETKKYTGKIYILKIITF